MIEEDRISVLEEVKPMHRLLLRMSCEVPIEELRDSTIGPGTRNAICEFQRSVALPPSGNIDAATLAALDSAVRSQTCTVRGIVRSQAGLPLANAVVIAVDRRLLSSTTLGTSQTTTNGMYEITYSPSASSSSGPTIVPEINLVVRAESADGKLSVESQPLFDAPVNANVDLMIGGGSYRGPTGIETLTSKLIPLVESTPLDKLDEGAISYLANASDVPTARITALVQANKLSASAHIPVEISFALITANLPADLGALYFVPRAVQRHAIERAIAANAIAFDSANVETELDKICAATVEAVLAPDPTGRGTLGTLLATTRATHEQQRELLTQFAKQDARSETVWKWLAGHPVFDDSALVSDLQFTFQLGALTMNHPPLITELKTRQAHGEISAFRDLARYTTADWQTMVANAGVPADFATGAEDRQAVYAATLARRVNDAYPTDVIRHQLRSTDLAGADVVATFLEQHQDFELGRTPIDEYLTAQKGALGTPAVDQDVAGHLKAYQRVFRLTPHFEEMQPLLRDGVHSAIQITQMGQAAFVARYGQQLGSEARAQQLYGRAEQITATAFHLYANYNARFNAAVPAAVQNGGTKP